MSQRMLPKQKLDETYLWKANTITNYKIQITKITNYQIAKSVDNDDETETKAIIACTATAFEMEWAQFPLFDLSANHKAAQTTHSTPVAPSCVPPSHFSPSRHVWTTQVRDDTIDGIVWVDRWCRPSLDGMCHCVSVSVWVSSTKAT